MRKKSAVSVIGVISQKLPENEDIWGINGWVGGDYPSKMPKFQLNQWIIDFLGDDGFSEYHIPIGSNLQLMSDTLPMNSIMSEGESIMVE
jgi:hypothetical protein